jgi:hypothetical protein
MKCERKHLGVNQKGLCNDIEIDKSKPVEDVSKDMFEHEPEIAPFRHCKCIDIRCNANKCLFNKEGECMSNGIFVGSTKTNAPCNSYQEK